MEENPIDARISSSSLHWMVSREVRGEVSREEEEVREGEQTLE